MKILFSNDFVFNVGLKAFLTELNSGVFWVGTLAAVDAMPQVQTDWATGGRDPSKDCVVADPGNGFMWMSVPCTSKAAYLCEAVAPDCPEGFTWVPGSGPGSGSCFQINSGAEMLNSMYYNSLATAETLCMEAGTRLAAPDTLNHLSKITDWLVLQADLKRTGNDKTEERIDKYWLGFIAVNAPTSSIISPWRSAMLTNADLAKMTAGTPVQFSKSFNLDRSSQAIKQDSDSFQAKPVDTNTNNNYYALCEYRDCHTTSGSSCKFPFRYKARMYDTCITFGKSAGESWCAIKVDNEANVLESGICKTDCPINNCPIGYHNHLNTCLRLSASHTQDTVSSVDEAETRCLDQGGRLYQPRSTKTLETLIQKTPRYFNQGQPGLLGQYSANSRMAIGINFSADPAPFIQYKDGSKFPFYLVETTGNWAWDDASTDLSQPTDKPCLFLKSGSLFFNDKCTGYSDGTADYLTYLCEAKPVETKNSSSTACHFPFKRTSDDFWHHSCIYDKTKLVKILFTVN